MTNTVTIDVSGGAALIDKLAEQLGIATDKVIPHYAAIEAAEGTLGMWLSGCPLVALLIIFFVLAYVFFKALKDDEGEVVAGCSVTMVFVLLLTGVLCMVFRDAYISANYPESAAIKELIRQLR